jgi:2,3-bisphosphoglycerate-dependent phosphoglycerate mutase
MNNFVLGLQHDIFVIINVVFSCVFVLISFLKKKGWADPNLSEQGIRETEHAARLLLAGGYDIDVVFTSRLKRAIRSAWIILGEMNQLYLPVFKSWRLNERMYGALTGLCKKETAEKLGAELVQSWRGSLKSRPPSVSVRDEYWPGRERRYSDLSIEQIPLTESLLDCMSRTEPVWEDKIKWELRSGKNVMVVAHANTLRGLVKLIDNIGDEEIQEIAIPTGIPVIYKFDKLMNTVKPKGDRYLSQQHMMGVFLEKPGILNAAMKKEKEWCENVPGYNKTMTRSNNGMSSLERSLNKLNAEKELREWAAQSIDPNDIEEDDGSDGNQGKGITLQDEIWEKGLQELREGEQFDPEGKFHEDEQTVVDEEVTVKPMVITNNPCMQAFPSQSVIPGFGDIPLRRDPVVVLIRHGKTEHNKLGLFTG